MNLQRLNELYLLQASLDRNDVESLRQLTKDFPYFRKPFVILARHYYETGHYRFDEMLRQAAMRVKDRKRLYNYIHGNLHAIDDDKTTLVDPPEVHGINALDTDSNMVEAQSKPGIHDFLEEIVETESTAIHSSLSGNSSILNEKEDANAFEEIYVTDETIEFGESEEDKFVHSLDGQIPISDEHFHDLNHQDEKPIEFEFESSFKQHEFVEPTKMNDIIGEEIATEFTFSSAFIKNEANEEILDKELKDESKHILEESIDLRKYPVYSIDDLKTETTAKGVIEVEKSDEAMDFFAWLNHSHKDELEESLEISKKSVDIVSSNEERDPSMDIIEKFITINPQITRPKKEFFNPENMAKRSEVPDLEFVSETLANIYYEQGNYELAIMAYEKLSLQNPLKQAYFADLIEKIKLERK